jgi:hypothetical protein
VALGARCPGHRDFAFGMEGFLSAHGGEHNRRVPLRAEEAYRHVDVLDVNEPARPNLDARVAFAIRPHCPIVVHAGGEIAEMRWRQGLPCGELEIQNIEGLVRRGNHFVALLKRIEPAKKLPLCYFASR